MTVAAIVLDGTLPEKPDKSGFRCVDRCWLKREDGLRWVFIGELSGGERTRPFTQQGYI